MLRASIGIAALALIALPLVAQGRRPHPAGTEARERQAIMDATNAAEAAASAAQAATEAADEAARAAGGPARETTNLVDAGDNMAVYGAPDGTSDNDMMDANLAPEMGMDANMEVGTPAPRAHRRGPRRRR